MVHPEYLDLFKEAYFLDFPSHLTKSPEFNKSSLKSLHNTKKGNAETFPFLRSNQSKTIDKIPVI